MITLIRNTSNEAELISLAKKKVCNVEEYSINTILGPIRSWRGSTEEEYFSLVFVNGMLNLCINEREMLLMENPVGVGLVPELRQAVDISKIDALKAVELTKIYTDNGKLEEDLKNITFDDCLRVLVWELEPDAKIFFDNSLL